MNKVHTASGSSLETHITVSLSTAALSLRKPAFAGISRDSYRARGRHKMDIMYIPNYILFLF